MNKTNTKFEILISPFTKNQELIKPILATNENITEIKSGFYNVHSSNEQKNIVLISDGCSFHINEYFNVLEAKFNQNANISVINKNNYQKEPIENYEKLFTQIDEFKENSPFLIHNNRKDIKEFIDNYIKDIVIPIKYDEKTLFKIINSLNEITKEDKVMKKM